MVVLEDRSKHSFTLDVSRRDFDRLRDLSLRDVVSFAHRYLADFPSLDLDPAQKESWKRLMSGDVD
ncbi:hypothetical protein BJ973_003797 [Actinoplanes tereljensis]|nr:hypothetical protein [Actinoplanes tereljensis]